MFDPSRKCHSYYGLSSFASINEALEIKKNHKALYVLGSKEQNISSFMTSQLSSPKRMEQGVSGHMRKKKNQLNIQNLSCEQITTPADFFSVKIHSYKTVYLDLSVNPK